MATPVKARVVHYINNFFAGVGGEEKAHHPAESRKGPLGPGQALQSQMAGKGEVVLTVFCGDNYIAEAPEEAREKIKALIAQEKPDVVVAGPAFNAGRYGYACIEVCQEVATSLGIPCVIGLHPENAGVEVYRQYKNDKVYALPVGETAADMKQATTKLAAFALKLAAGDPMGPAVQEGYISRGLRRPALAQEPGAERAVKMLLGKMEGKSYHTEIPLPDFELISPANPLRNLERARIALISTAGIVPKGNPDKIRGGTVFWGKYSLEDLSTMDPAKWDCIHSGYDTTFMNKNPNLGVPLDALRELEDRGVFGSLESFFLSSFNLPVGKAKQVGREMVQELKRSGAEGVLLVST